MPVPRLFILGAAVGVAIGLGAAGLVSLRAIGPEAGGGAMREGGGRTTSAFSRGGVPAISTASVQTTSIGRTIDAIGAGRATKSVTLVSEATGLVSAVAAKAGDRVEAGDVILRLEDSEQKIAVTRARAQYPIAKANAERYRALYDEDSASKMEADEAFNAFKAAEADLRNAEYALRQRTISAPFDGVVGLSEIEAGDYLRAGDVVTTIDDLSAFIVEFAIPQEAAADIKIGQKVTAALAGGGGGGVDGRVSAIDSRVDPASRTLKIEATFDNDAERLLPGATYAVTTTNEGAPGFAVPGLAVQWDRTGSFVWKLIDGGEAVRASVRVLQRRDEIAILAGDIAARDVVIVEGADRVRPGMSFPAGGAGARHRSTAGGAGLR